MFTFEDFKSLTAIINRDKLMSAISRIPEDDLWTALLMTLPACAKHMEIDQELWIQEHERSYKAETMLKSKFLGN